MENRSTQSQNVEASVQNNSTTSRPIMVLIAILVIGLLLQSWYMYNLNHRLNQIQTPSKLSDSLSTNTAPQQIKIHVANKAAQQTTGQQSSNTSKQYIWDQPDDIWNAPFDDQNWDPFQEMRAMQEQINRIFGNSFGHFGQSSRYSSLMNNDLFSPRIDLKENDKQFIVQVNLPGATKDNISVKLDGQLLTISGRIEQNNEKSNSNGTILRRERRSGSFTRNLTLPAPVKGNGMKTDFTDGVMKITIPKK